MEKLNYQFEIGNKLSAKAHALIPGGAHTYSKGDDQFPQNAPRIISRGKGCHLWDVDGNKFLDYGMALGSTLLGYANEEVLEVVHKEIENGVNFTRPSYLEAELAGILNKIIPSAEMVKFVKNGSDATTAAVKLARAATRRDYIARCSNDPFNSVNDWFIGSTVVDRGVPKIVSDLTLKFNYNDIESCKKLFNEYPGKIAGVILEPLSFVEHNGTFLPELQELCRKNGTILIFDEVVSGFRYSLGGVQQMLGITPDLTALGKSIANGFSLSVLVGKKEIMELGGIHQEGERVFLASTTYGAETHCLAAAIKTIEIMQRENLSAHMYKMGERLQAGVRKVIAEVGAEPFMDVMGYPCKAGFVTRNSKGEPCMTARTLLLQETCDRGLLFPYVNLSLAHTPKEIDTAVEIIKDALVTLKNAGSVEAMAALIKGPIVKPVFRKFN